MSAVGLLPGLEGPRFGIVHVGQIRHHRVDGRSVDGLLVSTGLVLIENASPQAIEWARHVSHSASPNVT
jgi:hypothetical protein